jgi:hypothetical protein
MLSFFMRLWILLELLRDRLTQFTTHQNLRVGFIFTLTIIGFFGFASPVFAEDGAGVIDKGFQTMGHLAYWVAGMLSKAVVLFIGVMTEVMMYNDFSTNRVVAAGWSIVRDTVNMFFVVVLIIIAFGTIFGHSKFQWQQQVPRLMIFALVINFSKTLCGIMIDFGQIIMLTFANAIREIAAGNFIQLLGLGEVYQVSTSSGAVANSAGTSAFDYFTSGLLSVVLMVWVFATMVILTFILIYRVVMLWVMIVISPLAWFMGGAGGQSGIISSNAYAQWWDRFKCLVAVGPVLTFFLWLTLAVAGAGNVAANTGFNPTNDNSADFFAKIFELDRFMSFLIGMAMLYGGFDAAQQFCSSMSGGFLGKSLKKGQGVGAAVVGKGIKTTAGLGIKTTAWGARKAGAGIRNAPGYMPGGAMISRAMDTYSPTRASARANLYRKIADKSGSGAIGRLASLGAARTSAKAAAQQRERYDQAGEKFKGVGREDKAAYARRFMEKGGASTAEGQRELVHLLKEAMTDKALAKEMRKDGTLGSLYDKYGSQVQRDFGGDQETREKMDTFKKQNLDVLSDDERKDALGKINTWDDVQNLSAESMGLSDVQARMGGIRTTIKNADGENMTAAEALAEGHGGVAGEAYRKEQSEANLQNVKEGAQMDPQAIVDAFRHALQEERGTDASDMIKNLSAKYADPSISGEDRTTLASGMDQAGKHLQGVMSDANASQDKKDRAQEMLNFLQQNRESAEKSLPPEKRFGTIPAIETLSVREGFEPESYMQGQFGAASDERLVNASEQLAEQINSLTEQMSSLGADTGQGEQMATLSNELEQLRIQARQNLIAQRQDQQKGRIQAIDRQMNSPADQQDISVYSKLSAEKRAIEADITNVTEQDITVELQGNPEFTQKSNDLAEIKKTVDTALAEQTDKIQQQITNLKEMQKTAKKLKSQRS